MIVLKLYMFDHYNIPSKTMFIWTKLKIAAITGNSIFIRQCFVGII